MSTPHERLRAARTAAGYSSAFGAATEHGWSTGTYGSHENGSRNLTPAAAKKYARAFKADWMELLYGPAALRNLPLGATPLGAVQVIGAVQAGVFREALEWPEEERYLAPVAAVQRFAEYPQFGLEVRGPSMNELYPGGSVVVCVRFMDLGREPKNGERVICQRRVDHAMEATVKELRQDAEGAYWLWPRSTDPNFQQPWKLPLPDHQDENEDIRIVALVVGSFRPEA